MPSPGLLAEIAAVNAGQRPPTVEILQAALAATGGICLEHGLAVIDGRVVVDRVAFVDAGLAALRRLSRLMICPWPPDSRFPPA